MRVENDEPIYTNTDPFMRNFVRQSKKRGRCSALNQYYQSTISDEVFNTDSKELNINGNIYETSDNYFEYTNKLRKILKKEDGSQFADFRENNEDKRTKHINKNFNKLAKHKTLQN